MIIAIDTEENLLALGVGEVILASSNDTALAAIDGNLPDFALLDFNLGGETSEPIARTLDGRGVPFAFATGYGKVEGMTANYRHSVGVLQKPYAKEELARILAQAIPALSDRRHLPSKQVGRSGTARRDRTPDRRSRRPARTRRA